MGQQLHHGRADPPPQYPRVDSRGETAEVILRGWIYIMPALNFKLSWKLEAKTNPFIKHMEGEESH